MMKNFCFADIKSRLIERFVLFFICLFCLSNSFGQVIDSFNLQNQPMFTSFEKAKSVPTDSVYRFCFKRKLPDDFEKKIVMYPNLQQLQINGAKLKKVPNVVWTLENLRVLDLANNRLDSLPSQIKDLVNLEKLILNRNYLISLPVEISQLSKLSYLDLWSNLIINFPQEISVLENSLKTVDMRVINIDDNHRENLQQRLPKTKFLFSKSCGCNNYK